MRNIFRLTTAFVLTSSLLTSLLAHAVPDKQSFAGGGLGLEVLSSNGSGTGLYLQGFGGYAITPIVGIGLQAGYSSVGSVRIRTFDFGGFFQLTEPESGFYGRLLLGGLNASVNDGGTRHGVKNNQTGFATGVAAGLLIPAVGDFHMIPEVSYRAAFLEDTINLITTSFNVSWDF